MRRTSAVAFYSTLAATAALATACGSATTAAVPTAARAAVTAAPLPAATLPAPADPRAALAAAVKASRDTGSVIVRTVTVGVGGRKDKGLDDGALASGQAVFDLRNGRYVDSSFDAVTTRGVTYSNPLPNRQPHLESGHLIVSGATAYTCIAVTTVEEVLGGKNATCVKAPATPDQLSLPDRLLDVLRNSTAVKVVDANETHSGLPTMHFLVTQDAQKAVADGANASGKALAARVAGRRDVVDVWVDRDQHLVATQESLDVTGVGAYDQAGITTVRTTTTYSGWGADELQHQPEPSMSPRKP